MKYSFCRPVVNSRTHTLRWREAITSILQSMDDNISGLKSKCLFFDMPLFGFPRYYTFESDASETLKLLNKTFTN